MNWKVLLLLCFIALVLNLIGGVVFHFLETAAENENRETTRRAYNDFLANNAGCVNRSGLDAFLRIVLQAYDQGIIAADNASSTTNWDILSSVFFSLTIATTIGYGHLSPSTGGSRAFCAVFAVLTIPLIANILGEIGSRMQSGYKKVESKLTRLHKYRDSPSKASRVCYSIITVGGLILMGTTLFYLVPAGIFTATEGWDYGTSVYYTFITLTTIGFGDYVAGVNTDLAYRGIYRLCLVFWILIGLSWWAMIISHLQEIFNRPVEARENKVEDSKEDKVELEAGGEKAEKTENNN